MLAILWDRLQADPTSSLTHYLTVSIEADDPCFFLAVYLVDGSPDLLSLDAG